MQDKRSRIPQSKGFFTKTERGKLLERGRANADDLEGAQREYFANKKKLQNQNKPFIPSVRVGKQSKRIKIGNTNSDTIKNLNKQQTTNKNSQSAAKTRAAQTSNTKSTTLISQRPSLTTTKSRDTTQAAKKPSLFAQRAQRLKQQQKQQQQQQQEQQEQQQKESGNVGSSNENIFGKNEAFNITFEEENTDKNNGMNVESNTSSTTTRKTQMKNSSLVISDIFEKNVRNITQYSNVANTGVVFERGFGSNNSSRSRWYKDSLINDIKTKGFPSVYHHQKKEYLLKQGNQMTRKQQQEKKDIESMLDHWQFFGLKRKDSRNKNENKSNKKPKMSLFAQRMEQQQNRNNNKNENVNLCKDSEEKRKDVENENDSIVLNDEELINITNDTMKVLSSSKNNDDDGNEDESGLSMIEQINNESNLLDSAEIDKIGSENNARLATMDVNEIAELQKHLMATLDPDIIKMLTHSGGTSEMDENKMDAHMDDSDNDQTDNQENQTGKSNAKNDDQLQVFEPSGKGFIKNVSAKNSKSKRKEKMKDKKKNTNELELKEKELTTKNHKQDKDWIYPADVVSKTYDTRLDDWSAPGPSQSEKMEWMKPIPAGKNAKNQLNHVTPLNLGENPGEIYRFGFDGELLCDDYGSKFECDDIPFYAGLHHHGQDALKPGYTIRELIHLSRSTVKNQRHTAFDTLSNIIENMRKRKHKYNTKKINFDASATTTTNEINNSDNQQNIGQTEENKNDISIKKEIIVDIGYTFAQCDYIWILMQDLRIGHSLFDSLQRETNYSCIMSIIGCLHKLIVPQAILLFQKQESLSNDDTNNNLVSELVYHGNLVFCNTIPNSAPKVIENNQFVESLVPQLKDKQQEQDNNAAEQVLHDTDDPQMQDIWKLDIILGIIRNVKWIEVLENIIEKYIYCDSSYDKLFVKMVFDILETIIKHHPEASIKLLNYCKKRSNCKKNLLTLLLDIVFIDNNPKMVEKWFETTNKNDTTAAGRKQTKNSFWENLNRLRVRIIHLFWLMCCMTRSMVDWLANSQNKKTLEQFKQFMLRSLSSKPTTAADSNRLDLTRLSINSIKLWQICVGYGYDWTSFIDLYPIIVNIFQNFPISSFKTSSNNDTEMFELKQFETRAILNLLASLLTVVNDKNLKNVIKDQINSNIGSLTQISWNQIAKPIENILGIINSIFHDSKYQGIVNRSGNKSNGFSSDDFVVIAGCMHTISEYFTSMHHQDDESLSKFARQQVIQLCKRHIATWNDVRRNNVLPLFLVHWKYEIDEFRMNDKSWNLFPFLDGLCIDIPSQIAQLPSKDYVIQCDCLLSIIRFVSSLLKVNFNDVSDILCKSQFIDGIFRVLLRITNKYFHFRLNRTMRNLLFDYWRIEWILCFEILMMCFKVINNNNNSSSSSNSGVIKSVNTIQLHSSACVLVETIPPGYQYYGYQLLNQIIFSRNCLKYMYDKCIKFMKYKDKMYQKLNNSTGKYENINNSLLKTEWYIAGGSDIGHFKQSLFNIYCNKTHYLREIFCFENKSFHIGNILLAQQTGHIERKNIKDKRKLLMYCNNQCNLQKIHKIENMIALPVNIPTFWLLQPLINLYKKDSLLSLKDTITVLNFLHIISMSYRDFGLKLNNDTTTRVVVSKSIKSKNTSKSQTADNENDESDESEVSSAAESDEENSDFYDSDDDGTGFSGTGGQSNANMMDEITHYYWCHIPVWDNYRSIVTVYLKGSDIFNNKIVNLLVNKLILQTWKRIGFIAQIQYKRLMKSDISIGSRNNNNDDDEEGFGFIFDSRLDTHPLYPFDSNDPSSIAILDDKLHDFEDGTLNSLMTGIDSTMPGRVLATTNKTTATATATTSSKDSNKESESFYSMQWQSFYNKLVENYSEESFGNELFSEIIFYQMQMFYSKSFRRTIWASISCLAQILHLQFPPNTTNDVSYKAFSGNDESQSKIQQQEQEQEQEQKKNNNVSVTVNPKSKVKISFHGWKAYFIPFENDNTILDMQCDALCQSNIPQYSFLYCVGIVHLSAFIFQDCKLKLLHLINKKNENREMMKLIRDGDKKDKRKKIEKEKDDEIRNRVRMLETILKHANKEMCIDLINCNLDCFVKCKDSLISRSLKNLCKLLGFGYSRIRFETLSEKRCMFLARREFNIVASNNSVNDW